MSRKSIPVQEQQSQQPVFQSYANAYSPPPQQQQQQQQQQQAPYFPSSLSPNASNAPANMYYPANQYAQSYMPPPPQQQYYNNAPAVIPLTSHPNAPRMTTTTTMSKPSSSSSSSAFPQQMQHQLTTDTSSMSSPKSTSVPSPNTLLATKKSSTLSSSVPSTPSSSLREATMKKYKTEEALLVSDDRKSKVAIAPSKEKNSVVPSDEDDDAPTSKKAKKSVKSKSSSSMLSAGINALNSVSPLANAEKLVTSTVKPFASSGSAVASKLLDASSSKSKSTRRGSLERPTSSKYVSEEKDVEDFVVQKMAGKASKKSAEPEKKKPSSLWGSENSKKKEVARTESPVVEKSKSVKKSIPVSNASKVAKSAYVQDGNEEVEYVQKKQPIESEAVKSRNRPVMKKYVEPDEEEEQVENNDDENESYVENARNFDISRNMGQRGRSSSITSSPPPLPPVPTVPDWLIKIQKDFDVQFTQEWINILIENEIDFDTFFLLTEKTLAELGLPLGARLKILKVIDSDKKKKAANKMAGSGGYSYAGGSWAGGFDYDTPSTSTDDSSSVSSSKPLDEASEKVMQSLILKFPRNLVIQHCDLTILHANQIGRGGFGSVVEGRLSGRPVAVKLFDDVECGIEECLITSELYHKNVISLLAVTVCPSQQRSSNLMAKVASTLGGGKMSSSALNLGAQQPRLAMVMELAEGSLLQLLQSPSGPTLDFDLITRYVIQIAQALAFLHTRKPMVLHLDLKPGNLLLTQDLTTVKLCDFSISKQSQKAQTTITSCVGTPIYMCFQQFVLGSQMDPSFDCYSFGAVLSYLISGEEPYGGKLQNFIGIDGKPTPLVDLLRPRKDCPDFLIKICKECLAVDPKLRPKNGEVLLQMVMEGCKGFAPSLVTGIAASQMIGVNSNSSNDKKNNNENSPSSSSSSQRQQETSSTSGGNDTTSSTSRSGNANNKSYSSNSNWTGRSGGNNANSQNQDVTEVIEFGNDDF